MIEFDGVIVVEGKNDVHRLKKLIDGDFIITNGLSLSDEKIEMIKQIAKKREVIVFTDPDSPGNRIRQRIINEVDCKQVFIQKEDALGDGKVGVEHASDEVLLEALNHVISNNKKENSIDYLDYYELGLTGKSDSKEKRKKVAKQLHLGYGSGKTFFKWLNMAGITKEDIEKIL